MSVFNDYSFHHSRPIEASELPEGYFHIIPSRVSSSPVDSGVIDQIRDEWSRALGKESTVPILDNKTLSSFLYVYPECPPTERGAMFKFAAIVALWSEEIDRFDAAERKVIVHHLACQILTRTYGVTSFGSGYEINDPYYDALTEILWQPGCHEHEQKILLKNISAMLETPTRPSLDKMTFGAYKEQRSQNSAGKFASLVIPIFHGLHISESEQASVASLIKLGSLITGLASDFESFHVDFEKHATSDSLDVISNAMAVLMANYGYTEEEASDILKSVILFFERQFLIDYDDWEASPGSKSTDLRAYMALWVTSVGGACYAQAISPRYHGLERKTTAEDRAQLTGRNKIRYNLHGYPPPASSQKTSSTPRKDVTIFSAGDQRDILAPFQKAPAEQLCMAPYEYTKSTAGKKMMSKFIKCLRTWLDLPDTSATIIEHVTDMIFQSTLMIDDIEDDSMLRRGKPAAHLVFGKSQTINSATYLFAKASRDLDQLQQEACKAAFLDELETLALGQALDLHWKFQKKCPTTSEYLTMVDNKTGGLFRMALRVMEIESKTEPCPDLMHLITLMGRYYQIRDDYMNLTSDEYTETKGYCEDLSEGKLSFPLIHALQNSPAADMMRGLLFHRENGQELSSEMKRYVIDEMKKAGSLAYARDTAMQLFDAMMETLERVEAKLGPNEGLKALLRLLKL
ncbi:bifunctional terpene synthase/polyprenyl synthetase family protein [Aspergillus vadensis CBS 113365]|uniref:Geranylgeranyl pyrophosphate synthase n=1 Tax=Aspergillus vadensis (strain CBS 113365 / IMI 142717 / IBT 24658) TaxID=1448311 RepID=A0A319BSB1_ASPVC|nr:geranylgeranyl pyrophosphate synthase [Aspergillus vadensis CBS 113365]PYH68713.1 geranylgeranyl pyrophosphate synthase [Aspergillus vadensis CBS 113365]